MSVEFVPADHVRVTLKNVHEARRRADDAVGSPGAEPGAEFWEALFEANAVEVLSTLPDVKLTAGHVVHYRFFGQRGSDLLVRPFVARATTDIEPVRRLIEWHAPPDSLNLAARHVPTQDVALLYRHFTFAMTAIGVFDYWVAMQELWASARWTHSHIIASAAELSQLTSDSTWQMLHSVEACEPAVVVDDHTARLAVLMGCPLNRFEITLQQIDLLSDKSLRYGDPILVAAGPKGYVT
ncbi:MAG: hypothetical protein HY270_00825 [Deltaproteobacteria bacterium]|nr:hypothetical protein [Deltaproteobacteria bacterium]